MARQKWQEWENGEDNLNVLRAWARAGLTDEEIAKRIGISRSTLAEWKKKYPNIGIALSTGKELADRLVENSLYKMTQGFTVKVKKAFKVKHVEYDDHGRKLEKEEIQLAEETEYIKPDVKAIVFWLKNRRPEDWREKDLEVHEEEEGTGILVLTEAEINKMKGEVQKDGKGKKVSMGTATQTNADDVKNGI